MSRWGLVSVAGEGAVHIRHPADFDVILATGDLGGKATSAEVADAVIAALAPA